MVGNFFLGFSTAAGFLFLHCSFGLARRVRGDGSLLKGQWKRNHNPLEVV